MLTPGQPEPPGAGQLVLFLHVPNHHQIDSAIGCPALCRTVAFDRTICRVARSRDWRRIEAVMLDQQGDYRSGPRRGELPVRFETGVVNRHIVSMTFDPDLKTVTSQNGYDDPHHRWVSHPSYVAQRG
jgi:hypothetical protein